MLKRKIEDTLTQWKNTPNLEPEEIMLIPIDTDELNQLAKQVLDNNEI